MSTFCKAEAVGMTESACGCARCALWTASHAVTGPAVDINDIVLAPVRKRARLSARRY